MATGGGTLFVVAVGRLVYHEPMGALGILGILVGLVAMILLALPG